VIDDGVRTDGTSDPHRGPADRALLRHEERQGKGHSLREGFAEALRRGFDGVLTMDGDGQHHADDIPRLLEAAQLHPGALIIGSRLRKRAQQPAHRTLANDFGDWGISWGCGYRICDTQSGQRFYPANVCALDDVPGEDFVFEAQILISAARHSACAWCRCRFESRYQGPGAAAQFRKSHFRPLRDLWRSPRTSRRRSCATATSSPNTGARARTRRSSMIRRANSRPRACHFPTHCRNDMSEQTDVVVLGGGLAGLSLAIQLRQRDPSIAVTVLERRTHSGARSRLQGGRVHRGNRRAILRAQCSACGSIWKRKQLRKFGFRFFFSEGREDLDQCTETRRERLLPPPSWQLDRGRFENFLGEQARALGVRFLDGATVRTIELSKDDTPHVVGFDRGGASHTMSSRWVVDAAVAPA
jgi:hypothetical protein